MNPGQRRSPRWWGDVGSGRGCLSRGWRAAAVREPWAGALPHWLGRGGCGCLWREQRRAAASPRLLDKGAAPAGWATLAAASCCTPVPARGAAASRRRASAAAACRVVAAWRPLQQRGRLIVTAAVGAPCVCCQTGSWRVVQAADSYRSARGHQGCGCCVCSSGHTLDSS